MVDTEKSKLMRLVEDFMFKEKAVRETELQIYLERKKKGSRTYEIKITPEGHDQHFHFDLKLNQRIYAKIEVERELGIRDENVKKLREIQEKANCFDINEMIELLIQVYLGNLKPNHKMKG
jgi:hypothetical protein